MVQPSDRDGHDVRRSKTFGMCVEHRLRVPPSARRCILAQNVFRGRSSQVQDRVDDRQGRLRTVYLRRHVDGQKVALKLPHKQSVDFGRAAARAAAARSLNIPTCHDLTARAGERFLYRDGVRGGRDARSDHRRDGAIDLRWRSTTLPDLQRRRSTQEACSTAICAVERARRRQAHKVGFGTRLLGSPAKRHDVIGTRPTCR